MNHNLPRSIIAVSMLVALGTVVPVAVHGESSPEFCAAVDQSIVDPLEDLVANCTDPDGDCYPHSIESARIRLFLWIIRGDGGNGLEAGITDAEVDTALAQITLDYAASGISFEVVGRAFLDDQALFDRAPGMNAPEPIREHILANYSGVLHDWAIDVFLLPADASKLVIGGASDEIPGRWMFSGGKRFYATNVVSHELGHCLGLYHTFERALGEDFPIRHPGGYVEGLCRTAGDRICDTPPDPFSRPAGGSAFACWHPLIDEYCNYSVTEEEFACDSELTPQEVANQMLVNSWYEPDTHNIMSYYIVPETFGEDAVACLSTFTPLQGDRMLACIELSPLLQPVRAPGFVDVSSSTEITYPGSVSYSAAGFNFDGSGEDDLVVTFGDAEGEAFRWSVLDGTVPRFAPADPFSGADVTAGSRGLSYADFDNDGDLDLFVAHQSTPRLYRNNGGSPVSYTDVAASLGVAALSDSSWAGSWGDFDRDGWLDLYVVRAGGDATPTGIVGAVDRLLRSKLGEGGGFEDVTASTGLELYRSKTICASWADVDADGNLDLFAGQLATAYTVCDSASALYMNQGDGTFVNVAGLGGPVGRKGYVSGVVFADVEGDADLDMVLARQNTSGEGLLNNVLVRFNNGAGSFTTVPPAEFGVYTEVPMEGVAVLDHDLNGTVDLLATPVGSTDAVQLYGGFSTTAGRVYVETGTASGLDVGKAGGVAVSDFNADGDPDVYLGRPESSPFFYQNVQGAGVDAPVNHWVGVELVAPHGGNNRSGIGSVVKVSYTGAAGPITQVQQVDGGSGRGEQQSPVLRYGMGQDEVAVTVEVTWPDGYEQMRTIPADSLDQVHPVWETKHAPGIVAGSFSFVAQPSAGGAVDLVARWTTLYNSEKDSLQVTVENYPPLPPQCEGISGSLRLKAGMYGVATSVKVVPGGYLNEVRYSGVACQTVCSYRGKNPRCAMKSMQSTSSDSKKATITICVQ